MLFALCVSNAAVGTGTLLPDLDSGVAIDENNMVDLLQVKESLEERRGPVENTPGESDEELFKEGAEGATGATGATGGHASGMTGSKASQHVEEPPKVAVVTFHGKKHTPFKCRTCLPPPDPNMPINYKKRRAMRKAKKIVKDVLEGFPDRIYSHDLSLQARCVDTDPYYPDYKNPIGLINPTPLRRIVRRAAEDNRKSMLDDMSDMHVGANVVTHHYVSQGYDGVDAESEDERLKDPKDLNSVDFAMNTTEYVRDAIMSQELEDALKGNEKLKQEAADNEKKDNEEAEAATE